MELALRSICGPRDIITPVSPRDELKAREMGIPGPQNYQIPFLQYQKRDFLRLIRNGKRIQFYNHMPAREIRQYFPRKIWDSYFKFCFERNPFDKMISLHFFRRFPKKGVSFEQGLREEGMNRIEGFDMYGAQNQVLVDQVYAYEGMEKALNEISQRIGLKATLQLPNYRAKGQFRTDRRPYQEWYDSETRSLLEQHFDREMTLMGYSFEEGWSGKWGLGSHK